MCEMLTAVDNNSKCQMVFAKVDWGRAPCNLTSIQSFQGVLTLVMAKGIFRDKLTKQSFQELHVL